MIKVILIFKFFLPTTKFYFESTRVILGFSSHPSPGPPPVSLLLPVPVLLPPAVLSLARSFVPSSSVLPTPQLSPGLPLLPPPSSSPSCSPLWAPPFPLSFLSLLAVSSPPLLLFFSPSPPSLPFPSGSLLPASSPIYNLKFETTLFSLS